MYDEWKMFSRFVYVTICILQELYKLQFGSWIMYIEMKDALMQTESIQLCLKWIGFVGLFSWRYFPVQNNRSGNSVMKMNRIESNWTQSSSYSWIFLAALPITGLPFLTRELSLSLSLCVAGWGEGLHCCCCRQCWLCLGRNYPLVMKACSRCRSGIRFCFTIRLSFPMELRLVDTCSGTRQRGMPRHTQQVKPVTVERKICMCRLPSLHWETCTTHW